MFNPRCPPSCIPISVTVISTASINMTSSMENINSVSRTHGLFIPEDEIQTEVTYLIKDPKHEHEKPYELRYDPEGIIPTTNMETEARPIMIRDFRPLQNYQSFDEYGFSLAKIDCALTASDLDDKKRVEDVYYPQVEKLLSKQFPDASEIKILEHGVRIQLPSYHIRYIILTFPQGPQKAY
jgi:hypothetical protein